MAFEQPNSVIRDYLASLLCASLWAIILPSVDQSVYFHQKTVTQSSVDLNEADSVCRTETRVPVSYAVQHVWSDFTSAFTNWYVVKWAMWWALSTCGYSQVLFYIQLLWQSIRSDIGDNGPPLYGIVEAVSTLLGAMSSMTIGKVQVDWARVGEPVLAVCAGGVALLLVVMSSTRSMAVAYLTYMCFTIVYHTMITVANSEVAKHINRDSYGLVFGVTTFFALVLQTGLTYVVNKVYQLPSRNQFVVYASYFGVLGVSFMLVTLASLFLRSRRR